LLDRGEPLPVEQALKIAEAVAAALQFAHERGVVHRDIKPENILLQAGQPLVADFGIALAVADAKAERLTQTGVSIGTPGYMSPEQAMGERDVDPRTDIYSLGCLVYEMLTGAPPFTGPNAQAVLTKVVTESPRPLRALRPAVPKVVEEAVHTALAKERGDRFSTAEAFVRALEAGGPAAHAVGRFPKWFKPLVAGGVVVAVAVIGVFGYRLHRQSVEQRWLRETAIPEIERLMGEARFAGAYRVATAALQRHPEDSVLRSLFETSTMVVNATSQPPGARVRFRGYASDDTTWYDAGVTPLSGERLPDDYLRIRFDREGYQPLELGWVSQQLDVRLVSVDEADPVVWVPEGRYAYTEEPVPLDSFLIDRHEVTNAQFQAFVDAGGYRDEDYWRIPFRRGGRTVAREAAMAELVDATGRPGPAGWELGRHSEGHEYYPVGGVSWYEAVAYCVFAGKSLPTFYHWQRAAGLELGVWDDMLAFSNFGGEGPVPVESLGGVTAFGAHDMAGNVREWVWNATRDLRYSQGGAWSDPEYMFTDGDARDPWSRAPEDGFRCAKYDSPIDPEILEPLEQPFFDFNTIEPVDDATFAIYRSFYDYEPIDLDARLLSVDSARHWIKQKVDFTAAYADERVSAYVFLPRDVEPPYQTVVYFPGSSAFSLRSSENLAEVAMFGFIPRSGRALVYPVYKGTYERYIEDPRPGLAAARQRMVWRTQDLQRTVDYVLWRDDLRDDAVGYLGLSLGAEIAVPVAIEKRFKALVLIGGAFDANWRGAYPPEAQPWNFASRITTPAMLINGRRDFMHPYETGQVPYFNAFDVPEEDKEFVVLDSGHVPDWRDVIRYTLQWFDRYLGPVR
jgi:formylglycine-generating enzyme required for sulfatase activity/dienelactone hydrolase